MFSDFKQEQSQQTKNHMGEATLEKTEPNSNFKFFKLFGHEFIIREPRNPNVPPATESASNKFKLFGYEFSDSDKTVIEDDGILSFDKNIDLDLKLAKSNDKQDDQVSKEEYSPKETALRKLKLFGGEFTVSDFIESKQNHCGNTLTEADVDEHHHILSLQEKTHSVEKSVSLDEEEEDQILGRDQEAGSTRKLVETGDDEEWICEKEKPLKKRKKNYSEGSCSGTKIKKNSEPAKLPERFKNKISEMGGTETILLLQKSLSKTDVSEGHGRLLMPLGQMKNLDFLLNKELQELETEGSITVPMIWPSLQIKNIVLTKWNMSKSLFVFRKYWNDVVKVHGLKAKDEVQVWSFRVEGQLNLALVKII